ncbi:MAG TPA: hypothetical protein PLU87_04910 [Sedimentisphaerales bacterium]|nr:hypothetical protein [Sedimentisphaerales bacterium]HRS11226.1 hypothetical protein [Sedimentisphaerales bacterium]HRV47804.1 hypothetical protein [Sedimentisphaerales bacterium]
MCFPQDGKLWVMLLACLVALALAAPLWGQATDEDEVQTELERRGFDQFDHIHEALHRWGKVFVWVAAALLGIVAIKIIDPLRFYYGSHDRLLKRAVRGVDELLKRIQEETASAEPEPQEEAAEGGLLAGMAEVVQFSQAEQVPAYVLTVNDLMLDNVRVALSRLRRFQEGHAQRYKEYMFTVLKGIQTLTVDSVSAGVPSSLAVDAREYFRDEKRYKAWKKLLSGLHERGGNQETIDSFLLFMRDLKEGRPLGTPTPAASAQDNSTVEDRPKSQIPEVLNEETLPRVQRAAAREAANLVAMIQDGKPRDQSSCWQFELVRRQQQLHLRDEAQRMLVVFLSAERKALPQITKTRMLPCRTLDHVLHMLGVADLAELKNRIEARQVNIQEIILLEKMFLQTFAKRSSLERVYGRGADAGLMMDLHVPQLRREALALLRRLHETEPQRFDRATQALDEEETPQRNEVRRLIEQYVHRRQGLPDVHPPV